jgi:hypothetical protein
MERWSEVRRRVLTGALTKRAARQEYHLHWDTLTSLLENEEPLGYRRRKERQKPVLGPFIPLMRHPKRSLFVRAIRSMSNRLRGATHLEDARGEAAHR